MSYVYIKLKGTLSDALYQACTAYTIYFDTGRRLIFSLDDIQSDNMHMFKKTKQSSVLNCPNTFYEQNMKSTSLLSNFPSGKRNTEMVGMFKNKQYFEHHRHHLYNQFEFQINQALVNSTYVYIDDLFINHKTTYTVIIDKLLEENKQVQVVINSNYYDSIKIELDEKYKGIDNLTIVDNISDYDKLCIMVSCKKGGYYTGIELGFWASFFLIYVADSIEIKIIYTEPVIMICGCQKYKKHLILALKRFENTSCKVIGIIGGVSNTEYDETTQILSLNVEDNYENVPKKIYEGIKWIYENYPKTRGIFKTDDDIYFPYLKQLIDTVIRTDNLYMGCFVDRSRSGLINNNRIETRFSDKSIKATHQSAVYCWGAGYWLHNSVLSYIVNSKEDYTNSYLEDVCTGYVLNLAKIYPIKLDILYRELPRHELDSINISTVYKTQQFIPLGYHCNISFLSQDI